MRKESMRRLTLFAAAFVSLSLVDGADDAMAHPEFKPQVINRYVKFDLVAPNEIRLAYTIMFGAAPALAARKLADENGDGRLDDREIKLLGARYAEQIGHALALDLDGARWTPIFDSPQVGLAGSTVAPDPFSIDLTARIHLVPAPAHAFHFDDVTSLPTSDLGEDEIRITEGPETRLLTADRGAPPATQRIDHFVFSGAKFSALEDRSISFSFEGAAAKPTPVAPVPKNASMKWILLGGLGMMVTLGWLLLRRNSNHS